MVFLERPEDLLPISPSLTKIARLASDVGKIEFKAFDSCDDFQLYAGLLALLKGVILDDSLSGRALTLDPEFHQASAKYGFEDEKIRFYATQVLAAAKTALLNDPDSALLQPLTLLLARQETPAHGLMRSFQTFGTIEQVLRHTYQ